MFTKENEELKLHKRKLVELLQEIRKPIYNADICNKSYGLYFEEANLDGCPYSMPFLIFPTRPCSWLMKSGGCFECGYSNLSNRAIKDSELYKMCSKAVDLLKNIPHKMVAIGTSGSFLDEEEISKDVQNRILETVSALPNIAHIGIESRPEYITGSRLREISELVWPKKIILGTGLETSSNLIRNYCINKGLNTNSFLRALEIIKQYENISALAYILLGKPFLSKEIDLFDALKSINWAIEHGFDGAVLMSINLKENTLTRFLFKAGLYAPPNPKRIIEILRRLEPQIRSRLILADPRLPAGMSIAQCNECSQLLSQLLILYKYTSDYNYIRIADELDFNFQRAADWEKPAEQPETIIAQMILNGYKRALTELEWSVKS